MAKKSKIVLKLEAELAEERRRSGALAEWFICSYKEVAPIGYTVAIRDRGTEATVLLHGLDRSSGGVAVVQCAGNDWQDFPRYLDDLLADWRKDTSPYVRNAAAVLEKLRKDALQLQPKKAS